MCIISDATILINKGGRYMRELLYGFEWKLLITVPAAFISNAYMGDWRVLLIWFGFLVLDCVAGWYRSLIFGTYDPLKLWDWGKKALACLATIAGLNFLLWGLEITSGEPNTLIDWFIWLFALSEAVSATNNFAEAGIHIHPTLRWILFKMRKNSLLKIAQGLGDGNIEDLDRFEKPKEPQLPVDRRNGQRADNGRRRRESDDREC